ncbi:MAG: hypothetical protein SP1CHLAM9_11750 [Chlamydiia bacterium]|nr:hypothetical protein [Chlamydiia bacterium]
MLFSAPLLFGEVVLYPNPAQQYNTVANFANLTISFFIQVNDDGSVTLQSQPPPPYPQDETLLNSGIALIDSEKVVQNYTATEAAALDFADITFTIKASPNSTSQNGYSLNATLYQWLVNLDPRSDLFYQLQSTNITTPYSLNALNNPTFNSNNGEFSLFFNVLGYNKWVSASRGAFLSQSLLDNAYFTTGDAQTDSSQDFTYRVDFTKLPLVTAGTYSFYIIVQMTPVDSAITFLETITNAAVTQQTQVIYLYNSILAVDAYLDGNNALYDPLPADQAILNTNQAFLIDLYNKTLAAMQVQWTAYSLQTGLSSAEITLINTMLAFIAEYQAIESSLTVPSDF